MSGTISVTCDSDVYDFLLDMKEKSGASMSQQANRLMRNGVLVQSMFSKLDDVEFKLDQVMTFMQYFAENMGHQEQVQETIKQMDEE